MSTDDQKRFVNEYLESVWNRGDLVALEELTTPSFTYQPGAPTSSSSVAAPAGSELK